MLHDRACRGFEHDALVGEILSTVQQRTIFLPERLVLSVSRLVKTASRQGIDGQVQKFRRRVDVQTARLDPGETIFDHQIPRIRRMPIGSVQSGDNRRQRGPLSIYRHGDAALIINLDRV